VCYRFISPTALGAERPLSGPVKAVNRNSRVASSSSSRRCLESQRNERLWTATPPVRTDSRKHTSWHRLNWLRGVTVSGPWKCVCRNNIYCIGLMHRQGLAKRPDTDPCETGFFTARNRSNLNLGTQDAGPEKVPDLSSLLSRGGSLV
jgi:hypothetical protein